MLLRECAVPGVEVDQPGDRKETLSGGKHKRSHLLHLQSSPPSWFGEFWAAGWLKPGSTGGWESAVIAKGPLHRTPSQQLVQRGTPSMFDAIGRSICAPSQQLGTRQTKTAMIPEASSLSVQTVASSTATDDQSVEAARMQRSGTSKKISAEKPLPRPVAGADYPTESAESAPAARSSREPKQQSPPATDPALASWGSISTPLMPSATVVKRPVTPTECAVLENHVSRNPSWFGVVRDSSAMFDPMI